MEVLKLQVTEEWEGTRLDKFLSNNLDFVSRSYIQKIIKEGNIIVNNRSEKGKYPVKEEDIIIIRLPDSVEPNINPHKESPGVYFPD